MKSASLFCFLLLGWLNLHAAPGSDAVTRQLEIESFQKINDYRVAHGLAPLIWNEQVALIARKHSQDMAEGEVDFGHEGFGDRVRQVKAALEGSKGYGENVFETNDPNDIAGSAVQNWLHSPHHYANIVGDYNLTGMGVWRAQDGTIYFTQFFVKREAVAVPVNL